MLMVTYQYQAWSIITPLRRGTKSEIRKQVAAILSLCNEDVPDFDAAVIKELMKSGELQLKCSRA